MNNLLRPRIWPSFSPSCRLYEPEAWRPRVFLRQAQDRLPLRRTVQVRLGTNPAVPRDGFQVARPPRLSEQARDGGQARPSSWSRDSNS